MAEKMIQNSTCEQNIVLKAFSRALTREAHVLTDEPDLLWQQLYNRLQWEGEGVKQTLASELTRRCAPGARPWLRLKTPYRESEALIRTLQGHTDRVNACAFSPNGRFIVSASDDKTLRVWDAATGQSLRTMEGHTEKVSDCAFSPDGQFIVSSSYDKTLRVWEVTTGQIIRTLEGDTEYINKCVFSPDGSLIASTHGNTVQVWNATFNQQLRTLEGNSCVFSPDGHLIATACADNMVRVWETVTGKLLRTFAP